jgi:SAM-dependent methyltransferase
MQSWFRDWFNSPYYYQLYADRDEREASEFVSRLIEHLKPPPDSRMLDVACGKGRHSLELAEMGFDVTGIDLSEYSIGEAKKHETANLQFFQHDMRLPFRINYYDYAFNFFTSFGYFKTQRENDNAIRTISQSLKPNGIFVIDYLNVHFAEDHLIHRSEKKVDDVNFVITKWLDETHFYKKIMIEDEKLSEPLYYTEKVAKFSLGDFTDMLSYQGLQVKEVYGDYQFSPYSLKQSPRMIIIAEKIRIIA